MANESTQLLLARGIGILNERIGDVPPDFQGSIYDTLTELSGIHEADVDYATIQQAMGAVGDQAHAELSTP